MYKCIFYLLKGFFLKIQVLKTLGKFIGYFDFSPYWNITLDKDYNYNLIIPSVNFLDLMINSMIKKNLIFFLPSFISYLCSIQNDNISRNNITILLYYNLIYHIKMYFILI